MITPADIDVWERFTATLQEWFAPVLALPWSRVANAPLGIHVYLGTLAGAVLLTGLAAFGCIWRKLDDPAPPAPEPVADPGGSTTSTRIAKKRFGLKSVALLLIAILPGGLVGSVAVLSLLGKENWRSNAVTIFEFSLIPALGLIWMDLHFHPVVVPAFIQPAHVELEMFFGLTGAFMHFWITLKYLKQYWSEPDERLPMWPPAIWWAQIAQVGGLLYYFLGTAY